jgi:phosphoribosylformylglycinamidine cyclo-ligase
VRDGDAILFLASSGVQTNGLTLCRALADRLPQGYLTPVESDSALRTYGEALLDPSAIYVRFIAACQDANIPLHYAAHVTGHGWRKLMRLNEPFVYRVTELREPPPVFRFIQQHGPVSDHEAYATFNMGVGFAVYVSPNDADAALKLARDNGYEAWLAGTVRKQGGRKGVEIAPLGITYGGETLQVR